MIENINISVHFLKQILPTKSQAVLFPKSHENITADGYLFPGKQNVIFKLYRI